VDSSVLSNMPQIVSLFPCLSDISEQDWNQEGIEVIALEQNKTIQEGQALEYAFLILEGTIRMYKISSSGREITLYRIHSGECCPLMTSSILGESAYEASACTEKRCLALAIPVTIFRDWAERYRSFRQYIFKSVAKRIIIMSNLVESINFKSIRGRIAEYLIQMTENGNDTLAITHDMLSIELGTAREVISRTLKTLKKEGLITLTRGKITIVHRTGLKNYIEL